MPYQYCNTTAFVRTANVRAVADHLVALLESEGMRRIPRPVRGGTPHLALTSNYWSLAVYPGSDGWTLIQSNPADLLGERTLSTDRNRFAQLCGLLSSPGCLLAIHDGSPRWGVVGFEADGNGRFKGSGWWYHEEIGGNSNEFYGYSLPSSEGTPELRFELFPEMQLLLEESRDPLRSLVRGDSDAELFSRHLHYKLGGRNQSPSRAYNALAYGTGLPYHGGVLMVFEWPAKDRRHPEPSTAARNREQLFSVPQYFYDDGTPVELGDAVLMGAACIPAQVIRFLTTGEDSCPQAGDLMLEDGKDSFSPVIPRAMVPKQLRLATRASNDFRKSGLDWLKENADKGIADAQFALANHYASGDYIDRDEAAAVAWMRRAADQQHPAAQFFLGQFHCGGFGLPKDPEKAFELWRLSAAQGYAAAQYTLGLRHERGEGVAQSYELATGWYRKAADQGFAQAQCNLADKYERGLGVVQDYSLAYEWYRKSAVQGTLEAQYSIGMMYRQGLGRPVDMLQAGIWLQRAAREGYADAQFELGQMAEAGHAMQRDMSSARIWYQEAAKKNHQRSIDRLDQLSQTPGQK